MVFINYPEYWHCIIGPITRIDLWEGFEQKIWGIDGPMRKYVEAGFKNLTARDAEKCISGWGIDENRMKVIEYISSVPESSKYYQQILQKIQEQEQKENS